MANEVKVFKESTMELITNKLASAKETGGLSLPPNYSFNNAMESAFLKLSQMTTGVLVDGDWIDKPVLEVCDRTSIAEALKDMVYQALTPAKNQCYFIPRWNKVKKCNDLNLMRSYHGTQAVLLRMSRVKSVYAMVIYEGEKFDVGIENGVYVVLEHKPDLMKMDNSKIIGAYCVITLEDGSSYTEIMNMNMIRTAWDKTTMRKNGKNNNTVQVEFAEEMAKRTVINRAAKRFFNTSDDSDLLIESINNTTENEYKQEEAPIEEVARIVETNANQQQAQPNFSRQADVVDAEVVTEPVQATMDIPLEDAEDMPDVFK